MSHKTDVYEYFAKKAESYDDVDQQVYWRLSDELLWRYLSAIVQERPDLAFLDAGGGTGRWSRRILDAFPQARGVVFDRSKEMMEVGRRKSASAGQDGRIRFVEGDLDHLEEEPLGGERFDLIFNFHNVLGFVEDPQATLEGLASLLATGGHFLSVIPNKLHAAYFNLSIGNLEDAVSAIDGDRSRFTDTMPYMHVFSPERALELHRSAGLVDARATGFPALIFPSFAETQTHGSTPSLVRQLSDPSVFEAILELEWQTLRTEQTAARGNNLLVHARAGGAS